MKWLSQVLLIFALTLAASSAASGQEAKGAAAGGLAEEILRLEREYEQYSARPTSEAFERLHAADFRMTARGRVTTRAEFLARLKDPSQPRDVIESLTTDDVQVRVYGDAAVSTGRWKRVSKSVEGRDTSAEGHYTRVWVRRDGRWLLAVAHYSPKAAPPRQP